MKEWHRECREKLLELFQIHSRIKADLPDLLHLGSGEAENLPTPGLGAGRGGASPDPWILGSGESEHLPTPGLGVGRIGDRPSRGQAHPTPGLRSDEAESQAHPTPGRRGLKVGRRGVPSYHGTESPYRSIPPVWGVGTIYILAPLLGFCTESQTEEIEEREIFRFSCKPP